MHTPTKQCIFRPCNKSVTIFKNLRTLPYSLLCLRNPLPPTPPPISRQTPSHRSFHWWLLNLFRLQPLYIKWPPPSSPEESLSGLLQIYPRIFFSKQQTCHFFPVSCCYLSLPQAPVYYFFKWVGNCDYSTLLHLCLLSPLIAMLTCDQPPQTLSALPVPPFVHVNTWIYNRILLG